MPTLDWWATVFTLLASATVVLGFVGGLVATFTKRGRRWIKRQFDITEVLNRLEDVECAVDDLRESQTEDHAEVRQEIQTLGEMAVAAYQNFNELIEDLVGELDADLEEHRLDAERVERDLGDGPRSTDYQQD